MWSKKHVGIEFYFTSTSEKELETCYASSDSSEDEDSPQEAEVNMTESVVLPGRQGHRSDLLVGTKCGPDVDIIVHLDEYTLLSFYNSSTDHEYMSSNIISHLKKDVTLKVQETVNTQFLSKHRQRCTIQILNFKIQKLIYFKASNSFLIHNNLIEEVMLHYNYVYIVTSYFL